MPKPVALEPMIAPTMITDATRKLTMPTQDAVDQAGEEAVEQAAGLRTAA